MFSSLIQNHIYCDSTLYKVMFVIYFITDDDGLSTDEILLRTSSLNSRNRFPLKCSESRHII